LFSPLLLLSSSRVLQFEGWGLAKARTWVRLGLVAAAFVIFNPRSTAQIISCSSDDGLRRYCPADTRGGVRLLKKHSDAACNQGFSWGFDRGGVWVDRGCRADFATDSYQYRGPAPGSLGTISCSSDDGRRHYCTVDSDGRVRLQQQRGDSPCREGYSWGSDGKVIWVDHGCRADFAVEGARGVEREPDQDITWGRNSYSGGPTSGGPNAGGQSQVVSCSSDDMHRHYCPADTRGGVQLLKQRSDSACRQGRSWGFDRSGIWVDHGCRADFQVFR
jgi:Protein of unknown function (DUF3011)